MATSNLGKILRAKGSPTMKTADVALAGRHRNVIKPLGCNVGAGVGVTTSHRHRRSAYQWPVFGIESHGSAGGFASPFCNSSIECRSGERTKAITPSRGGRLMVMPAFIRRSQVA